MITLFDPKEYQELHGIKVGDYVSSRTESHKHGKVERIVGQYSSGPAGSHFLKWYEVEKKCNCECPGCHTIPFWVIPEGDVVSE